MMNQEKTSMTHRGNAETDILNQIVDAMLAVETSLENATIDEWQRILVSSCRRQKGSLAMASTC